MSLLTLGAVAGHFGRDVGRTMDKLDGILEQARRQGVDLLVLPGATIGGYLVELEDPASGAVPEPVALDGPEVARLVAAAGPMVVCVGLAAASGDGLPTNTAVCLTGDGVLGVQHKVHLTLGERDVYTPGTTFDAIDTPVGRLGMLIDYDKTFPEGARSLALDGAHLLACLSAWPASVTERSDRMRADRQSHLFDLYDEARAAENQVVVVSANHTGTHGGLRFLGQSKVVGPGGQTLARLWGKGGLVTADLDVGAEVARARRTLSHLAERVPVSYRR